MRIPLLVGLSLLAPISALDNHAPISPPTSPPIFILKTTHTATSVLGKALGKLGYSHQDPITTQGNYSASPNTYVEVTSDTQLLDIAKSHPEAKFIVPRGSRLSAQYDDGSSELGAASWWWGQGAGTELVAGEDSVWFAQAFLSEKKLDGVLELDVLALEAGAQAENWVRLCDFLGLGYSVVERFGLWHFPR
ncbi:hypothetical protein F4781DRAFT_125822 [Annulohypoxylon bovei var. microspora]|nr:hypothetical protein F4781DRAFT_125822 [Annulohypoxylon bovei var. microspora]